MISPSLNLLSAGFDMENAQACLLASSKAYAVATISDAGTDTQVLVLEPASPGAPIIVAFRGSQSLKDWLTDADAWEITYGAYGRVHRGFYRALEAVADKLRARLDEWGSNTPIFITGHSLGGALAMLYARCLDACAGQYDVHSVYTFGQPRVGDKYFAERYDSALKDRTFRVVNDMDVVPRLPMLGALVGTYRHAGTEIYLTPKPGEAESELAIDPGTLQMAMRDGFVFARSKFKGLAEALEDHLILSYFGALGVPKPAEVFA